LKKQHYTKVLSAVFCICTILVLSTACRSEYHVNRVIAVTQACYAIPGGYVSDIYASRAHLIETDEYGRRLMSVKIETAYGISALCISQRVDEEYVYYYDNVNYVCIDDYQEYETYQVDTLKDANDWGEPLDEEKMVKRELNSDSDLLAVMNYGNIHNVENSKRIFEENISIPTGYKYSTRICDWDATGKEIYLASTFTMEDTKRIWHKYYLMVINADGTYNPETFIVEFDDLKKSNQPLAEVKEKNDWQGKTSPLG
jgi:hypothetical protein